ncbi:ABC transporter substrate-binding protein [Hydrogenophaga sp.]|uniref:ABC transporter substrate-binding protein n=1 Tax=Hydrogenophaga sp. TaxID=1904254 RepID=UPI0025BF5C29|nr:ABC transporter substrate-binding protein [Hydrogenophaga sp.]
MPGGRSVSGRPWMARARRSLRWLSLVVALGALACSEPAQPPLMVGVNTWVGYDPLVLARDREAIDALKVKVVELVSSAEAVRHLRNGLLDAAGLTLDEALRLVDSGFGVRIVALLDTSAGADMVVAAPRITSLQQLRGEAIAAEDATVATLMLERLLRKARLRQDDVTVVRMDATQHLTALLSDRVAAAVSYAPMNGPIQALGYRPIFDSREMPGQIVDVLVVRNEVLEERPEAVDALMGVWAAGLNVMQLDPQGAAASMAPGAELTPAQYQSVQQGLRFYSPAESLALLSGQPPLLAQQSSDMAQLLQELGLLREPPNWANLIDTGPAVRARDAQPLP